MPTPDPSASLGPFQLWAVEVAGYGMDQYAAGLDLVRLLIFAIVVAVGVVAFATVGLLVTQVRGR